MVDAEHVNRLSAVNMLDGHSPTQSPSGGEEAGVLLNDPSGQEARTSSNQPARYPSDGTSGQGLMDPSADFFEDGVRLSEALEEVMGEDISRLLNQSPDHDLGGIGQPPVSADGPSSLGNFSERATGAVSVVSSTAPGVIAERVQTGMNVHVQDGRGSREDGTNVPVPAGSTPASVTPSEPVRYSGVRPADQEPESEQMPIVESPRQVVSSVTAAVNVASSFVSNLLGRSAPSPDRSFQTPLPPSEERDDSPSPVPRMRDPSGSPGGGQMVKMPDGTTVPMSYEEYQDHLKEKRSKGQPSSGSYEPLFPEMNLPDGVDTGLLIGPHSSQMAQSFQSAQEHPEYSSGIPPPPINRPRNADPIQDEAFLRSSQNMQTPYSLADAMQHSFPSAQEEAIRSSQEEIQRLKALNAQLENQLAAQELAHHDEMETLLSQAHERVEHYESEAGLANADAYNQRLAYQQAVDQYEDGFAQLQYDHSIEVDHLKARISQMDNLWRDRRERLVQEAQQKMTPLVDCIRRLKAELASAINSNTQLRQEITRISQVPKAVPAVASPPSVTPTPVKEKGSPHTDSFHDAIDFIPGVTANDCMVGALAPPPGFPAQSVSPVVPNPAAAAAATPSDPNFPLTHSQISSNVQLPATSSLVHHVGTSGQPSGSQNVAAAPKANSGGSIPRVETPEDLSADDTINEGLLGRLLIKAISREEKKNPVTLNLQALPKDPSEFITWERATRLAVCNAAGTDSEEAFAWFCKVRDTPMEDLPSCVPKKFSHLDAALRVALDGKFAT